MESKRDIDEEKCKTIKTEWDEFAECYEQYAENLTIQSSVVLYSLTSAFTADRICEVAVGCGKAARMFIAELMKDGAVYFASDISEEMIKIFEKRFDTSALARDPKVKLHLVEDNDELDTENLVESVGKDVSKRVFALKANNEKLPYPDGYFDMYLASLSLMLVNDHINQLSEAYRVLQEGGTAGFTVWGRRENSNYFTFLPEILKVCEIELPSQSRSPFHLGDKDQLEKDIRDAGFKEVKMFYTQTNVIFKDVSDFFKLMSQQPFYKSVFQSITKEQHQKVEEELRKQFDERFGPDSNNPMTWELLVCIAKK